MSEQWVISKEFHFEFGHTVHSQNLNPEYSVDNNNCCRALHGHSGRVVVELQADALADDGMVTDFKHLNWFKKFIDEELDHKMIIDLNDPGIEHIIPNWTYNKTILHPCSEGHQIVQRYSFKFLNDDRLVELLEGFVFVDFVPTSENLCKWLYKIVQTKMAKINVKVSSIQFFETSKSQSQYRGDV